MKILRFLFDMLMIGARSLGIAFFVWGGFKAISEGEKSVGIIMWVIAASFILQFLGDDKDDRNIQSNRTVQDL